jgi:ABC-type amino acid transport substrate-binding protein
MSTRLAARRTRVRSILAMVAVMVGVIGCAAVTVAVHAQAAPLTLVSTIWSPFTNAQGKPRFALDLVETAFTRIGVAARTEFVPASDFTTALISGKYDGSAAAWRDPQREKLLLFSQPYLENRLVLVGRRGSNVSAQSLDDLNRKRVAIVEGYSYGETAEKVGPVFVRSRSEEDSVTKLLAGDVDYALIDELVVEYIVGHYPKESATRLAIGSMPLVTRELHLAIRRTRTDAQSIIDRFNGQLRAMVTDRTYNRLLNVDWIRADVDGDGVPELVPRSDQTGPTAPVRFYQLFSQPEPLKYRTEPKTGVYVGGNIYSDWADVPRNYKQENDPHHPDSRRSTASIFGFSW